MIDAIGRFGLATIGVVAAGVARPEQSQRACVGANRDTMAHRRAWPAQLTKMRPICPVIDRTVGNTGIFRFKPTRGAC
jgi:hypothetical protein